MADLDAIGDPTTTILKPPDTTFQEVKEFMVVTAGPSRSSTTIRIPIGVSLVQVDFDFITGDAGLRVYKNGRVTFPIAHEYQGISSHMIRIVNDDPLAWIALESSKTNVDSRAASRASVTIYPMLAV